MKSIRLHLGFLSVLFNAGLALSQTDSWTQWRGPQRDGMLNSVQLPETLTGSLKLAWEKDLSPSYSGPIIFDDLIYTTETVDKKDERVTAYRIETGEEQWSVQWEGSMSVPFFAAANGDWIRSTPAVSQDGLVIVGMRDVMVCLDHQSGERKWSVDFPKLHGTPLPMFGASCSPLIDGDAVYFQSGGATVKLSMKDGSMIWQTLKNGASESPGAFSSPMIATLGNQRQLLVQTRLELCGVELETGSVLWKQPITAFRGMNILTPLVSGNRVFTSAHSGKAQMFEVTVSQGNWSVNEIWQQKHQAYMSSPVLINNTIFLHLKNKRFTALDAQSGQDIYTTSPIAQYVSIVTDGNRVLALTNTGELLLIDGKAKQFSKIDQLKVANDSWAHVAVTPRFLAIRDLRKLKVFLRN